MALGWPVMLKGPMPGAPIRPVRRWQLISALALSVPALDWFTPWLQSVTTFGCRAKRLQKAWISDGARPVRAGASAATARAACRVGSSPSVRLARKAASAKPLSWRWTSSAAKSATSLPGRRGRCSVAPSQLAVRRGSSTISFISGRAARAAARRW